MTKKITSNKVGQIQVVKPQTDKPVTENLQYNIH